MNFCGICYKSRFMHFHSTLVKNKRRSRNKDGELVYKSHFEHESIDGPVMLDVFKTKVLPWCEENDLDVLIMDNDPKLHSKAIVTFMWENDMFVYPGGGKNPWVILFFHDFNR